MSESDFTVEVFQNEYLPSGAREVNAIVTVTAPDSLPAAADSGGASRAEIIIVDCSGSMDYPHAKIVQARAATAAALDVVSDGVAFAVIAGTEVARRHRDGVVAEAGPPDVRLEFGHAAARHFADRRQERARGAGGADRGDQPVRGILQLRLPRRRYRLAGRRAAADL